MKTTIKEFSKVLLTVFKILLISITFSCSKDGAQGKDGSNSNIITTPWVLRTFNLPAGRTEYVCNVANIPQITESIIQTGLVLTYRKTILTGVFETVPYRVGTTYTGISYKVGGFDAYSGFNATSEFRHIIILSESNFSARGISKPDYTKMSYQEICKHFNINE
jgi:hypothetical protein